MPACCAWAVGGRSGWGGRRRGNEVTTHKGSGRGAASCEASSLAVSTITRSEEKRTSLLLATAQPRSAHGARNVSASNWSSACIVLQSNPQFRFNSIFCSSGRGAPLPACIALANHVTHVPCESQGTTRAQLPYTNCNVFFAPINGNFAKGSSRR